MKGLKTIVAAALLMAAGQVRAESKGMEVSVIGGYATLNMDELNENLMFVVNTIRGNGGKINNEKVGKATGYQMNSGSYIGVEGSYALLPKLKVGPRIELVGANQAKISSYLPSPWYGVTLTEDAYIMMYEAGVSTDFGIKWGFNGQIGLWGGWGMANGQHSWSQTDNPTRTDLISGTGFVGELAGKISYPLMANFSLGLDLGWRVAKIDRMVYSADSVAAFAANKKAGESFQDFRTGTRDIAYDFGGWNYGLNLSYSF